MHNTSSRITIVFCMTCLITNMLFLQPLTAQAAVNRTQSASPLILHTPLFAVNNAVWSPDGQRLAIASTDGILQTWSLGGRLLTTHVDRTRSIHAYVVGWSRDGRSVISYGVHQAIEGRTGTTVERWDATTGKMLLKIDTLATSISFSPDRTRMALAGITLEVRDAVTGKLLRSIKTASALSASNVQWSPDGTRLAVIDYNSKKAVDDIAVWNALTGQQLATYYAPSMQGVKAFAWSADSRNLFALSSSYPSIVQKWSATNGKILLTYPLKPDFFVGLSASPNGKSIALQGDSALQVWSATTTKLFFAVSGNNVNVTGSAWSPDGTRIVLIGGYYSTSPMQIRVAATGHVLLTYPQATAIGVVTWNGALLTTISGGVSVWSTTANRLLVSFPQHHQSENSVTWSPDGKQIAAEDGAGYYTGAWNAQTGENLGDFYFYHEDLSRVSYRNIASVAWSPNGQHIAETREGTTVVWGNVPVACQSSECGQNGGTHNNPISQVAWSPDSTLLASASLDKTVLVYDVAQQKNHAVYTGNFSPVTAVAWSPNGKLVASGEASGYVAFWDPNTAKTAYYLRLHDQAITSVAWSPDGTRLALTSLDGFVTIWKLASKTVVLSYHVPAGALTSVAWSPDGKAIALAGTDKLVHVLNATTGQTTFVYKGHTDTVQAVAWSPNGTRIASASKDGTIQIWSPR